MSSDGGLANITAALSLSAFFFATLSKLVRARVVNPVGPLLVQINEENEVVPEAGNAVHNWHLDHESEQVIDECVQGLVHHSFPGLHTSREINNLVRDRLNTTQRNRLNNSPCGQLIAACS